MTEMLLILCGVYVPLVLDGKELPWVESALHLGHVLHESGSMDQDVKVKRATFIEESTKVRETFEFASPTEVLRAVKVYVGSHYGSNRWQLDSHMSKQYFSAWRTCLKLARQLPRSTNTHPSRDVAVMHGVVSGDVQTPT